MNPFDHCAQLVREHDKDAFCAVLFVPENRRPFLFAIAAFGIEIARIRNVVSDPTLGEIRLQWWSDVLSHERAGEGAGHPVAAAVLETIQHFSLSVEAFLQSVEARRFDLYHDPMPSLNDLEGHCGEIYALPLQLKCQILVGEAEARHPLLAEACGHAGVAYGLMNILQSFAQDVARGQLYCPQDILQRHNLTTDDVLSRRDLQKVCAMLQEMRIIALDHVLKAEPLCRQLPLVLRPAFLLLGLVEKTLAHQARFEADPFKPAPPLPQWRKQWALWMYSRSLSKTP
jgi:15-cis-phytoene synthase